MSPLSENVWNTLSENAAGLLLLLGFVLILLKQSRSYSKDPPMPWGWPIVGHLYSLGKFPHITLTRMSKKYGDIFQIRLGSRAVVVINGNETLRYSLTHFGTEFAGRPSTQTWKKSDGLWKKSIFYEYYSEDMEARKKMVHRCLHVWGPRKNKCLEEGLQNLAKDVLEQWLGGSDSAEVDNVNDGWKYALARYSLQHVYGIKTGWNDLQLKKIINLTNLVFDPIKISYVNFLPLFTLFRSMPDKITEYLRAIDQRVSCNLEGEDNEHEGRLLADIMNNDNKSNEVQNNGNDVKTIHHLSGTFAILFSAIYSDPSNVLDWLVYMLVQRKDIQTRVREEIFDVLGHDKIPDLEDRERLPYSQAVVFEMLRWSPAAPLAAFHETTQDVVLRGFHIPKGTIIIPNVHSANFDERVWTNPEEFDPTRFLSEDGGQKCLTEKSKLLTIFGAGKRSCPGKQISVAMLFLILTNFCQACQIEAVSDENYESKDQIGTFAYLPEPYRVRFTIIKEKQ